MQQVNVLPTFVSQDTDIKSNDTYASQRERKNDKDFSALVDQHIKKKDSAQRNNKQTDNASNDRGKEAAKNERSDPNQVNKQDRSIADQQNQKNKSTSSEQEKITNPHNKQNIDKESGVQDQSEMKADTQTKDQIKEETTNQDNSQINDQESNDKEDKEALLASQKFISLLYNSDQALVDKSNIKNNANSESNAEQLSGIGDEVVSEEQTGSRKNNLLGVTDESIDSTKIKTGIKSNETLEHKLKAFADKTTGDELLTSKDLLSRYQEKSSLTDAQSQSSIDKLTKSELNVQNQFNINKDLLKVVSGEKQAPLTAEPIIDPTEADLLMSELASKKAEVNNGTGDKSSSLTALKAEIKPQLKDDLLKLINGDDSAKEAEKEADNSATQQSALSPVEKNSISLLNKGLEPALGKELLKKGTLANQGESSKTAKPSHDALLDNLVSKNNLESVDASNNEKVRIPSIEQQATTLQANANAQKTATTQQLSSTQVGVQSGQSNLLDKPSVGSSENSEHMAMPDDLVDDTMLVNKENNGVVKPESNLNQSSNTLHGFTDVNSATSQVKQTNDAYNNYQLGESLSHNVASDTAQIQKNNVLLHQETISVFRKDFSDAVKDKVMLMINQKLQQFDITLDPPEFGNMQVRVNLQGEQAAVNFIVQNQQAKDALEQNMHKLKDMLAEQGVDVGGANVEQQNQQNKEGENQSEQQGKTSGLLSDDSGKDTELHVLSSSLFDSSSTAVDYYA